MSGEIYDVMLRPTGEVQSLCRAYGLAPFYDGPGPDELSCPADAAPRNLFELRVWIERRGGEILPVGDYFGTPVFGVPDAFQAFRTSEGEFAEGYMVRINH